MTTATNRGGVPSSTLSICTQQITDTGEERTADRTGQTKKGLFPWLLASWHRHGSPTQQKQTPQMDRQTLQTDRQTDRRAGRLQ